MPQGRAFVGPGKAPETSEALCPQPLPAAFPCSTHLSQERAEVSRLSLELQACWREPTRVSILCGYPGASDRRLPRTFSEAFISQEEREGLRLSVVLRILTGHPKQRGHKVDGLDSNLRMPGREAPAQHGHVRPWCTGWGGARVAETPLSCRSLIRASFPRLQLA